MNDKRKTKRDKLIIETAAIMRTESASATAQGVEEILCNKSYGLGDEFDALGISFKLFVRDVIKEMSWDF